MLPLPPAAAASACDAAGSMCVPLPACQALQSSSAAAVDPGTALDEGLCTDPGVVPGAAGPPPPPSSVELELPGSVPGGASLAGVVPTTDWTVRLSHCPVRGRRPVAKPIPPTETRPRRTAATTVSLASRRPARTAHAGACL